MEINRVNKTIKYYFLFILSGVLTGIYSTFFRYTVESLSEKHLHWIETITSNSMLELSMALTALGGAISFIIVKMFSPVSKASGISMIILKTRNMLELSFKNVIPVKTIGGISAVATGFFVGTEGPIIQIAAAIAHKLSKLQDIEEHTEEYNNLISYASCAGLASVFGAPISAIALGCEEIEPGWNLKKIMLLALTCFSGFSITHLLYNKPYFNINYDFNENIFHLNILAITFLTISAFALGWVYKSGLIIFAKQQSLIRSFKLKLTYTLIVGAFTGYILTHLAMIDGHGHWLLINTLKNHNMELHRLLGFTVISWALVMLCFCSGVVGGIFSPSLTLGVVSGYAAVQLLAEIIPLEQSHFTAYIIIFTLTFFISFMKTPITGIFIAFELFGIWSMWDVLIPIGIIGYSLFYIFPSESFYHYLVKIRYDEFKQFETKKE